MASQVAGRMLRDYGWSFGASLKDVSNAFWGTPWPALDCTVSQLVDADDALLCKKRHRDTIALLPSMDGDTAVEIRVGEVMGGPFMVAAISITHQRP
eukprot:497904-Pyramimonas_sp.AAC.1